MECWGLLGRRVRGKAEEEGRGWVVVCMYDSFFSSPDQPIKSHRAS